MRKILLILLLTACVSLSGCSWLDGAYVSVAPHRQQSVNTATQEVEVSNYLQLRAALEEMVNSGTENRVIIVADFSQEQLDRSLNLVSRYIKTVYPIGAYAVEDIICETGTTGGVPAVAVNITYLHNRTEILGIQNTRDMEQVQSLVAEAMTRYDTSLVVLVEEYQTMDIAQFVSDFAAENPGLVMETPEVLVQTYPNTGEKRIVELNLSYQTSRDDLRTMQEQVERIFASAALYVTQNASDSQKYTQLYAFLMERFDYQLKTSITPAYSLLSHGVGDDRSFAVVFAEMCEQAGLECRTVVGSRNGEPWCWNMVLDNGYYYHVDLLDCLESGGFVEKTDAQMDSYVWDYSAYPVCTGAPSAPPGETEVPADTAPETQPSEPAN